MEAYGSPQNPSHGEVSSQEIHRMLGRGVSVARGAAGGAGRSAAAARIRRLTSPLAHQTLSFSLSATGASKGPAEGLVSLRLTPK